MLMIHPTFVEDSVLLVPAMADLDGVNENPLALCPTSVKRVYDHIYNLEDYIEKLESRLPKCWRWDSEINDFIQDSVVLPGMYLHMLESIRIEEGGKFKFYKHIVTRQVACVDQYSIGVYYQNARDMVSFDLMNGRGPWCFAEEEDAILALDSERRSLKPKHQQEITEEEYRQI